MAIQGRIQFIPGENGREQIQLIIPQNQYEEFQGYKDVNVGGNVIDQEFYADFELNGKQLYITGSFLQEENDASSIASLESEVQGNNDNVLTISSVITQDNRQLDDVFAMAEELGLNDRNTNVNVELSKCCEIQNKEIEAPEPKYDENSFHADDMPNGEQPLFGNYSHLNEDTQPAEEDEQPELPPLENMTPQQLQDELSQAREHIQQLKRKIQELVNGWDSSYDQVQQLEQENQRLNAATQGLKEAEELKSAFFTYLEKRGKELQEQIQKLADESQEENNKQEMVGLIHRLNEINIYSNTGELNDGLIEELNKDAPSRELGEENEQIEELNAEVESLKKDLEAQNTKVKQLESEKAALEAKKQPTEQPKQGNGAQYTAAAGFGLAAGLVAFIALERTVRLDIWVTVGIALVAALAVSGGTYLALKPSTQVSEAETREVNGNAPQLA